MTLGIARKVREHVPPRPTRQYGFSSAPLVIATVEVGKQSLVCGTATRYVRV